MHNYTIREAGAGDEAVAAPLIAGFRDFLRSLKGRPARGDVAAGAEEFREYLDAGYPVVLCEVGSRAAGYLVCRVDRPVVWVEAIYVLDEFRRAGIGGALFERAEALARECGEETLYNYVHPNNDGMIRFLARRGYDVLNLIEIRKRLAGEVPAARIRVGEHEFDY